MIALDNGDKIRGDASAATVVDYTLHGLVGVTVTQLADGQLPVAIGDLYTAGQAGIAVTSIVVVNTDTVARTVNLYLTPSGGTARRLIPKTLSLGVGCCLITDGQKISVLDSSGQLLFSDAAVETLLAGGLPAALDSGNLKVKEQGTITVQATGADKLVSVESIVGQNLQNTNLAAGFNVLDSTAVPAGKLWLVTMISVRVVSSTITQLLGLAVHNAVEFWFIWQSPPASSTLYVWNGQMLLDAADYLRVAVWGATLGDDLHFHYLGYQMDAP